MRKSEIEIIKGAINNMIETLEDEANQYHPHVLADARSRLDSLMWVLDATGNHDDALTEKTNKFFMEVEA